MEQICRQVFQENLEKHHFPSMDAPYLRAYGNDALRVLFDAVQRPTSVDLILTRTEINVLTLLLKVSNFFSVSLFS